MRAVCRSRALYYLDIQRVFSDQLSPDVSHLQNVCVLKVEIFADIRGSLLSSLNTKNFALKQGYERCGNKRGIIWSVPRGCLKSGTPTVVSDNHSVL